MRKIPQEFQPFLWSRNVKKLDLERDKNYIIPQILAFGGLKKIKWPLKVYGRSEARKVFLENPQPIFTASLLHFVKNFILDIKRKFGGEFSEKLFLSQLSYLGDIKDFKTEFLKGRVARKKLERLFAQEIKKYSKLKV
ncbi:hypothetical protein KKH63_02880 [Patescibacteria group bacterium]|nr:hypothetical protein [Patescibacteria group bacterium]